MESYTQLKADHRFVQPKINRVNLKLMCLIVLIAFNLPQSKF